ncbi:hypothetical protein BBP40_001072 [Aspergillus hancockii]|nr:hypothetical protein BBP40_001072 [Aspergillus hancockii]
MYFSNLLSLTLLPLLANSMPTYQNKTTALGHAVVINNCETPIYLWSVSSVVGDEQTLTPHSNYTETFRQDAQTGGVSIKLATVKNGLVSAAPQTNFAYNYVEERVWYSLADVFGDPFKGRRVYLDGEVTDIAWENGVPPAGGSGVGHQGSGRDLTLTIC